MTAAVREPRRLFADPLRGFFAIIAGMSNAALPDLSLIRVPVRDCSPLVVYARRDTPPGLKVAADIMRAKDFKALSLSAKNSNTINQALALDLLGVKYQAVPAYRGLKEVETAILQNIGQLANSSLSGWSGSVEPTMGHIVMPLWQLSPRKNGAPLTAPGRS